MENTTAKPPTADPVAPRSEAAFLADQAAAAQQAVASTLEQMRTDLGASADLAAWARKYPWPTVGGAAALGFLAVVALTRPSCRQADQTGAPEPLAGAAKYPASGSADRGWFASLVSEVLRNLAGALQGALIAAIAERFQPPPQAADGVPATDGASSDGAVPPGDIPASDSNGAT